MMNQPLFLILFSGILTYTTRSNEELNPLTFTTQPQSYNQAIINDKVITHQPAQNNYSSEPGGRFLNQRALCLSESCYKNESITSRYCPFSTSTSGVFCEIIDLCCWLSDSDDAMNYDERVSAQKISFVTAPLGAIIGAIGIAACTITAIGDITLLHCTIYRNKKSVPQ